MTRRRFLRGAASALAATSGMGAAELWCSGARGQTALPTPATPGAPGAPVPAQLPTLREAGAARHLLTGCAVNMGALDGDEGYASLVRQQAGIVVAEDIMKFGPLRSGPEQFFFGDTDRLFGFAAANGMLVRGHNFVWHRQLPVWFDAYLTPQNAATVLVEHIETVGSRYAGRVHSWDVVNEAILLSDGLPGGLRNSPWYKLLGPGYLDVAFRAARRADPHALLCYNEYGLEGERPEDEQKRAAVLGLLRDLQARSVPLDAVGIQSHIVAGKAFAVGAGLDRFLRQIEGLGLKVLLTEMDINDRFLPADLRSRDAAMAASYRDYLDLTLAHGGVIALLTWGLTDRYSWLNAEGAREDKLPERGLPFDADLRPVAAYPAVIEAILRARPRG